MDWIMIVLSCIALSAAQTPAAPTYLSLVSSHYLPGNPRLHGGRSTPSGSADEVQLGSPAYGLHGNPNRTIQDIDASTVVSVDGNGQTDRQTVHYGTFVPQSRLLTSARSQGISPSLLIPGPPPFLTYNDLSSQPNLGSTQYNFNVPSSQNDQNSLNANSRSDDEPRLNPQYSGPSLFSYPAQAAAERRSSTPQYQLPTSQSFGVDPSYGSRTIEPSNLISRMQNAVPFSRSSLDEYYSSSEESQRPTNQNGYNIQQITQGNLDPVSYQFSYDVNAVEKGRSVQFAHEEQRGEDQAAGAYSVLLPDGQRQVVEYTADQDGYRPRVSYDGVDRQRPTGGDEADVYGSYESSVIAARSQSNGGPRLNSGESRYQQLTEQSRFQNRPY